ncbi:MAG: HU family DNA-binding protein, partial [Muribaculaceae bacterium]|nr:HU family DNA-binding protein [Muribaculaceae bacterium]
MNSIISLPRLIDLLSRASSKDKAICEDFIRCFAGGVGDALGKNGNVRIKGFGMFNVVTSGGVRRIVFIPDRELADAVNAPFACFEPVELAPGVSEDVLAAADDVMADTVTGNIIYESETEIVSETVYDQVEHTPESTDEEPSVSSCADSPSVVSDGAPDDASASGTESDAPAERSESGED